jgi:2,3-diketo-5-methylthio-1-phosphopentane phosphatase
VEAVIALLTADQQAKHLKMSFPGPLPALRSQPKAIFFTDFDGTITLQDSNDFLTDNLGFGVELRRKGNKDTLSGARTFRETFQEMMDSVHTPFDVCVRTLLENVQLDPKFKEFHQWCRANNVPIVVLSGGMQPIIRALLGHLVGEVEVQDMQIVSNDVKPKNGKSINEEDGWDIDFHDDRYVFHVLVLSFERGEGVIRMDWVKMESWLTCCTANLAMTSHSRSALTPP